MQVSPYLLHAMNATLFLCQDESEKGLGEARKKGPRVPGFLQSILQSDLNQKKTARQKLDSWQAL